MTYTRREFGALTLGALAFTNVGGVQVGVQTYSFRDLPRPPGDAVDVIIKAMTECGVDDCELWSPQIEPSGKTRDEVRAWRLQTPLDHFSAIKKKFDAARISIYGFNYSFNRTFTDEEIDRGFQIAKALGARIITASSTLDAAKRVVPFADKHNMTVAMHNHSRLDDPNEFATPESFAAARKMSRHFKVNLDIGHFTAANFDAVAYLREHHADITNLHIKDRKKNQGETTPWGQGDAPIREVLQLLKRERWPIRAHIEYEYKGAGTPQEEVKKCFAHVKEALA